MKIRTAFVSNSSSASFVVIDHSDIRPPRYLEDTLIINGMDGKTEFGWEYDKYYDFESKLNFAVLQIEAVSNDASSGLWREMLENVIRKHTNVTNFEYMLTNDYDSKYYGYIEHQSSSYEGQNTEIFDNEEDLAAFLFGDSSYICTDNDNH